MSPSVHKAKANVTRLYQTVMTPQGDNKSAQLNLRCEEQAESWSLPGNLARAPVEWGHWSAL